ncbi:MAG: chemotaxis protein CheA [Desulfobacterales bacterium]|nr:chemotaxis protein CheA [Desulfobacterales bacterium]
MKTTIESLASAFMMLEKENPEELENIRGLLLVFAARGRDENAGEFLISLAESAIGLIDEMRSGEMEDREAGLMIVSNAIQALQAGVEMGEDFCREMAPPELTRPGGEPPPFYEDFDQDTLAGFIAETRERLDAADRCLLTLETDPGEEEALNALFRVLHTIKGDGGLLGYEEMSSMAHVTEDLLSMVRNGEIDLSDGVLNLVFESIDLLRRLTASLEEAISSGKKLQADPEIEDLTFRIKAHPAAAPRKRDRVDGRRKLGRILMDSGHISREMLDHALEIQKAEGKRTPPSGEAEEEPGGEPADGVEPADRDGERRGGGDRRVAERKKGGDFTGPHGKIDKFIKIDAGRLDLLLDAIGELGIIASMVSQDEEIHGLTSDRAKQNLSLLDKITREILEVGNGMRMTPIRSAFDKMARCVRDLAKSSGKQIEFIAEGKETELDRGIVEKLSDPLIHLIRNAIDHGIEEPPARIEASKPEKGLIRLSAFHQEGNIFIEVSDDGRGLNRDKIVAKAKRIGLIREDAALIDREIFALIFEPGFSTADAVTAVSGRGVGMDVVKKNIETLRGKVAIASEPGRGASVSIRLPLTMANIEGVIVRVERDRYIIPIHHVLEVVTPEASGIASVGGEKMLNVRGVLIPFPNLSDMLGFEDEERESVENVAVIVDAAGERVALRVDELIGQQQFVVKKLSRYLSRAQGVFGAVIMPDGAAAFVLDAANIVHDFHG